MPWNASQFFSVVWAHGLSEREEGNQWFSHLTVLSESFLVRVRAWSCTGRMLSSQSISSCLKANLTPSACVDIQIMHAVCLLSVQILVQWTGVYVWGSIKWKFHLLNPSMTMGFKFCLLLRLEGFKFLVLLDEFGPYSAPMAVTYEKLEVLTVHWGQHWKV